MKTGVQNNIKYSIHNIVNKHYNIISYNFEYSYTNLPAYITYIHICVLQNYSEFIIVVHMIIFVGKV